MHEMILGCDVGVVSSMVFVIGRKRFMWIVCLLTGLLLQILIYQYREIVNYYQANSYVGALIQKNVIAEKVNYWDFKL